MERAIITDAKGISKVVNPSDHVAVESAVMAITKNWGIAQYIAEWCDIAYAGMVDITNLPNIPYIRVEIQDY